jgi:hypothetical protein
MGVNQQYFNQYTNPLQQEIDRVNVYEFDSGMDYELTTLGGEINPENIKKAQAKVIKNLKADPAYYTNRLAADSVKLVGEWGSGKRPGTRNTAKSAEAVKAEVKTPKDDTLTKDKSNEMKVAKKDVKSNVRKDSKVKNPNNPGKVASMTQTPKKLRGAKVMAVPGKEKKVALKENFSGPDTSLGERIRKNAPIKSYVKDFEKSDAPQFKGKSAEKKRNMAIAAHAQANPKHPMSEMGKKRPSDKEIEAAWEKYQADKKAKGEPIINVGKTTDANRRRIQNDKMNEFYFYNDKSPESQRAANKPQDILSKRTPGLAASDVKGYKDVVNKKGFAGKSYGNVGPKGHLPEDVHIKDSRTIRLTPENVKTIKGMIREMILKKANSKDTVVASNPNTINTLKSSGYQPISGTEDAK